MSSDTVPTFDVDRVVQLRHRLHRIPELLYEEFETAALIREELTRIGVRFVDGVPDAPTATVVTIGDPAKPCVALRADMDALPIAEQTGLPYASATPGRMHACGHDGHSAILLGTAGVLHRIQDTLPVCVKLIFQPAEEGGGGAGRLVRAGVLDGTPGQGSAGQGSAGPGSAGPGSAGPGSAGPGSAGLGPAVKAVFGLHGWPTLRVGHVSTRGGPVLAATDTFTAKFIGTGCHGAFPHAGHDPIVTAAEAVLNLQQFVSREMDPTEPAVVTVGCFHAGTATNIIPDVATIEGTARTLTPAARKKVGDSLRRRCEYVALANECRCEFGWTDGYPPTINDPASADYVAEVARATLGRDRFIPAPGPAMGGEDFAYYLEKVPGCFFFLGVVPEGQASYPPLHSDRYDFNDAALGPGVRMFVNLVRGFKG